MSRLYDITRGLPLGGVLFPLLWLLHFYRPERALERKMAEWDGAHREADVLVLFYADDIAFAVTHGGPGILAWPGRQCAADAEEVRIRQLGLDLSAEKPFNLVISPGNLVVIVFRQGGNPSQSAKRELPGRENRLQRLDAGE